jgi:hypothetical protein
MATTRTSEGAADVGRHVRDRGRRTLAALGVAGLLLTSGVPVHAAWTSSVVDGSYFLTRPSLRVDGADHTGIAYQRAGGSAGIFYTTNATGGWVSGRATTGSDRYPSLRFDAANKAHVAFARLAGSTGVYVTDNTTGSWSAPTLVATDRDPTLPSLAIDGSGHQGIAYTSNYSFAPGLYYATNASGSWVKTRISTDAWESASALQFDGSGHAHILFGRYDPSAPGLYYATNATGSWVTTRVSSVPSDVPSFVLDGSGKIRAAFVGVGSGGDSLWWATNATGSWTLQQLYGPGGAWGPPSLTLDIAGHPHMFASRDSGSGGRLVHLELLASWQETTPVPTDDDSRDDDFPSMAYLSDGTLQLAFRRVAPSAGLRFLSSGTNSSLLEGSALDGNVAMELGPSSARDIAISRAFGAGGSQVFATGTGSGWTRQTAGTGNPSFTGPDIAVDGTGKVRIVDGSSYDSNATASWTHETSQPAGADSAVRVDGSGHAHIVYSYRNASLWELHYKIEVSPGTFMDTCGCSQGSSDLQPDFVLDSLANPQIAWITTSGGSALILTPVTAFEWGAGTTIDDGPDASPSIAIDSGGKLHIAYVHGGSAPGIYYATNKTGTWVRTRLTRSYSDGAPSIAVDGAGHVYVATTRNSWAADPGVYVMTNATGTWVKARVVASFEAGDVALAVTSSGLARIVFATSTGVLEYESSTATLLSSGTMTLVRSGPALAGDGGTIGAEGASVAGPPVPQDGQSQRPIDTRTRTTPPRAY